MPAAMAAQAAAEVIHSTGIPIFALVTGFLSMLLLLGGWLLSLEQRKINRREFDGYSSKLESRMLAMQTDLALRITEVHTANKEARGELMTEMRDLQKGMRHVARTCPYMNDVEERAAQ